MIDIDLFAGAGGLALGLQWAGFAPLQLYENDAHACETLRHNAESKTPTLSARVLEEDVKNVEWSSLHQRVRLLAAGAPCQPFSLGGKHRASDDPRNLFPEVIRATRELRPAAILIENVRGLLRENFRPYFEYVLRQLETPSLRLGRRGSWRDHDRRIRRHQCSVGYTPEYNVSWRLLNAADYGVPQSRLRIFIVATRYDLPPYRFPSPTHSKQSLLQAQANGEYWERYGIRKPKSVNHKHMRGDKKPHTRPWVTVRDAIADLPSPAAVEEVAMMNHCLIPGARVYPGHSGSPMDWPAKTVKAGVHGVPGGENVLMEDDKSFRYFTFRELARLQSFPDSYLLKGARIHLTRQLGNAVPPGLARAVAERLHELLDGHLKTAFGGRNVAAVARV